MFEICLSGICRELDNTLALFVIKGVPNRL